MDEPEPTETNPVAEQVWRTYMTTGEAPPFAGSRWRQSKLLRPLLRRLPTDPRCRVCYYPFAGIGGRLVRALLAVAPSRLNPQLCNECERAAQDYPGGAEIELSMLFADVRGSTGLAETMSPAAFSQLIDRFYKAATRVLFARDALVEKLIGDEVAGFFVPGFSGKAHARAAVAAAEDILRATGHTDPAGPWIAVGVGVHTGIAFVGAVSSEGGTPDITVLGDTANTAARIAAQAGAGEIVISEATRIAAGRQPAGMDARRLELKGRREPINAWVIR